MAIERRNINPDGVAYRSVTIATDGTQVSLNLSPTLTSGADLPTASEPAGSIYLRTDGTLYQRSGGTWGIVGGTQDGTVIVTQANAADVLGGTIDSGVLYRVVGTVDCSGFTIEVPPGGVFMEGSFLDQSTLTSTGTLFTSPAGGSGDVFLREMTVTAAQVFDLTDVDGTHAMEVVRLNWTGCTSLGTLTDYRQGLETGTGRFGGTPSLTLAGTWAGGYRITTSIVRGLSAAMTGALFQAGTGFTMASRFLTDINCDLPASAAFCDFAKTNFLAPSLLQVRGAIFTRNGTSDASDTNIFPNISAEATESSWKNNEGIPNTHVGGETRITSEAQTVIAAGSTWYTLNAAAWSTDYLSHFDSPSGGQLRHQGNNPREFKATADLTIEGPANAEVGVRFRVWDDSSSSWTNFPEQRRQVNSLVGGRDVAFFTMIANLTLDQGDYVLLQVRNNSGNQNLTCETDSFLLVEER